MNVASNFIKLSTSEFRVGNATCEHPSSKKLQREMKSKSAEREKKMGDRNCKRENRPL